MVTIYDVARSAGVSVGTVSRFVNGSGYVGAASRGRIEAAIAHYGFVPSRSARSLTTKRSGLFAAVLPDLVNPFNAALAQGIADRAIGLGYRILIDVTEDDEEATVLALRAAREHQVEGIVIAPPDTPRINEALLALHGTGVAITLVGMRLDPDVADRVTTATYEGARAAIAHLTGLEHRRIGLIAGQSGRKVAHGRRQGYLDGLTAAGTAVDPDLIIDSDLDRNAGAAGLSQLLALPEPPTAVFAVNDAAALGAIQCAADRGIRIPEDLSIVGFDDVDLAAHATPPLTTVAQPKRQLGASAVELLHARITGTAPDGALVRRFDCELVIRSSTAPPPH